MNGVVWAKLVLVCSFSQGCTLPNGTLTEGEISQIHVDYQAIGVPGLLGGHGSSIPLTRHLSLTARHVAERDYSDVVAFHPNCDLAIIKDENSGKVLPVIGVVSGSEPVITVGKGFFGDTLLGRGVYHRDVNFVNYEYFETCPASLIDAPIQSGMSGGAVLNDKYELVGIITSKASNVELLNGQNLTMPRVSVFISLLYSSPWLIDTLFDYYEGHQYSVSFSADFERFAGIP